MSEQTRKIDISEYISECDRRFEKRLEEAALDIISRRDVRIIKLSGPTCSGKTTASAMLTRLLEHYGRRALTVSIDDFFWDAELLKKRAESMGLDGTDYDSVAAIDLDELERFVEEIFSSEQVHCPVFDFRNGRRSGYRTVDISPEDIVIFEGIQAVYPQVSALFSRHESAGVFIMPMTNIIIENKIFVPNEIRLMRRLVRDFNFRNTRPELTFELWKGVRKNEESSIFPYIDTCEYKVDSTMQYEIGILRPYLEAILEPLRGDSPYARTAAEMIEKVRVAKALPSELISSTSLYKEFI